MSVGPSAPLAEVVAHADDFLRVREIADWPNALNGLQIANSGRVTKIGAAVDASTETLRLAAERGIDFLVVHHGLFWSGLRPVTGSFHRQLQHAFAHNLALYGAHLPLDLHPVVGNNAELARLLGLENTEPFFETKGALIGVKTTVRMSVTELLRRLDHSLGVHSKIFAHGPAETRVIGIVSGAAAEQIAKVAGEGIDTFITGEAPHWTAITARELGLNLLLGGHYATETLGVKAFAAHLGAQFGLPSEFIDAPTGL